MARRKKTGESGDSSSFFNAAMAAKGRLQAKLDEIDRSLHKRPAKVETAERRVGRWLGKYSRAEPVAMLYDQGRVRHAGTFPELEDEMCDFAPSGLSSGRSGSGI